MTADGSERTSHVPREETSWHARRAVTGDHASQAWIVERFSPLLLLQASQRLGARLRQLHDPEDLVADVWLITLPNLADIAPGHARLAPVLLRYVSTVLSRRIRDLARGAMRRAHADLPGGREAGLASRVPDPATTVVGQVMRRELQGRLWTCLQDLSDSDREVLVARGIEQRSYEGIAADTGVAAATLAVRYHRALERLRALVPDSVLDDLLE